MNRLLLMLCFFVLSGCSSVPCAPTVQRVEIPVPVEIPPPPQTVRPDLEIFKLTPEEKNDVGAIAKAYKITVKQLQDYATILETALDSYRKKP